MAQIIKFPAPAAKLGFKRVRRRARTEEQSGQMHLFDQPTAQLLQLPPESGWFAQALLLDERGDAKAAELYEKAVAEADCIADSYCNLGILESQKGNSTKAFDCFTRSLSHDPRHAEAHYNLGNLYFDLNDFRLAQTHYEMAVEIDPSFASGYFNLALLQAINDDFGAAVTTLTKYRALVSEAEGRHADQLLHELKASLAAARRSRS
jgi:tetratricopeptide (TPR) repeat protein